LARNLAVGLIGAMLLLVGCHSSRWEHQHGADHPLAGSIVDVARQQLIDQPTLLARLADADIVLLGETHGNRDHHRLQAEIVRALAPRVSGVVFEMIDTGQQAAVVIHLQDQPGDTPGLGAALDWESSGWPDWSLYEPIAAAAVASDAEIVGGNLSRDAVDRLMAEGPTAALDPGLIARSGLGEPLDPALEGGIVATIEQAHCGFAPAELLPAMLDVQRSRDALMADRLVAIKGRGQSVLIAGAEHVRRDWGAPYYLARLAPEADVVTVALREVDERLTGLPVEQPYDYVWFTPRRQPMGFDPCEAYRDQLERLDAGLPPVASAGPSRG
jgi:uncharacterized iron-regulated protein